MVGARGLYLLIEKYVCILVFLEFELCLGVFVVTSKAFFLDLFGVYLIDKFIIKGVPLITGFGEGIVVSSL